MSTSMVTSSGSSAWTFCSASNPFRAVPMTRNSPEPSRICEIMRRMNALSSTTRTVGSPPPRVTPSVAMLEDTVALLERADLEAAVGDGEVHTPAMIAPDVFGDDRHAALGERRSCRGDVPVADVDRARGDETGEHTRAADELRVDAALIGAEADHLGEERGDRRGRELRR